MTNDYKKKTVVLTVSANVQVVLSTKPARINFGRVKKSDMDASKYVSLIGIDKAKTKIISAEAKNKNIKVEINPSGFENNKDKRIKISLLPGLKVGKIRDRITIKTDHEKVKQLHLSVYGDILGNITVSPSYLSLILPKEGKSSEGIIRLKAAAEAEFKVLEVKSSIPELVTTELKTVKEGKEYHVKVQLKEGIKKNLIRGNITINTDDEYQKKIEVKLSARVDRLKKAGRGSRKKTSGVTAERKISK